MASGRGLFRHPPYIQSHSRRLPSVVRGAAFITQAAYRGYLDDNEVGSNTPIAAANASWQQNVGYGFHIRFLLQNSSAGSEVINPHLQYRRNGGTWTNVNASSTFARSFDSPFTEEPYAVSTDLGLGTGPPETAYYDDLNGATDGFGENVDLSAFSHAEYVFCMVLRSEDGWAEDDTAEFRLVRDASGTPFDSYSQVPLLDVQPPQLIDLGLITQTATIHAPTIIADQAVVPDFIDQTAAIFALTVINTQQVSVGLVDQAAQIHAPTITTTSAVVLGLIDQTAVISAATVTTTNAISVALVNQTATVSSPTVTTITTVSVGLIDQTAASFNPTVETGAAALSVGLINQTAQIGTPTITTGAVNISANLITQTASASAPTITTANVIDVGRITQTATASAPSISVNIALGLITQTAAAFAPSLGSVQEVTVGLISQPAAPFAPTITTGAVTVSVGLINQTAVISSPTIIKLNTISVAQIDRTATASAPTITAGVATISVGQINRTAVAHTPAVLLEGDQAVDLGLIDQTAIALDPVIAQPRARLRVGGGGIWTEPRLLEMERDPHWMAPWPQFVGFQTIAVNAKIFSPDVALSDDEAIFGLSDEDLLVLA